MPKTPRTNAATEKCQKVRHLTWLSAWYTSLGTHLYVPRELIVAEDVNWCEFSNFIKLEFNLDRLSIPRVVFPANPPLPWNKQILTQSWRRNGAVKRTEPKCKHKQHNEHNWFINDVIQKPSPDKPSISLTISVCMCGVKHRIKVHRREPLKTQRCSFLTL